jgi:tripartite-type tricarboxylate transporter receptor subunit TctC
MLKILAVTLCALAASVSTGRAEAQDYPNRPIRMVVPFAPGGGADLVARAVAVPLGKRLGQQIIVDNKAGSGGTIGADAVVKAPADGYTLLYTTPGQQMTNPFLVAKLPYDADKDLVAVSEVAIVPSVLVVNKNLPVKSVAELIQYAKDHPGKVNFASAGIGASSHLAGELFKQSAKIDIVHVPYRGTGLALQDLLAGQVQMAIDSIIVYKPHIDSGALRPLGVSSLERSPLLPNVPPIADELPGFDAPPINYITVRSGTPKAIVDKLNAEINATLQTPEVREKLLANGVTPKGSTAAEMEALIQSERAKWKKVIEVSGARLD